MNPTKKSRIFIIDTSAILSGKPINLDNAIMITTSSVSNELKPGGRDYQALQFLMEKGLSINSPSQDSIDKINFKENLKICPICGSATKNIVSGRTNIGKKGRDDR